MPARSARWFLMVTGCVLAIAAGMAWALWSRQLRLPMAEDAKLVPRYPHIDPDYAAIVFPPNIAPLNFVVHEEAQRYLVKFRGEAGTAVKVVSRSPVIEIPTHRWRTLLESNRGKDLRWEVFVETEHQWRRFRTMVNHVAEDEIDGYLVYRLIGPVHNQWREVSIRQRDLTTFEDRSVLAGESLGDGCVNCHSFAGNDPKRMLIGIRSQSLGSATLLAEGSRVRKLGTSFGYTAWHPSGRVAAYSTNKVRQFFHASGDEVRDVVDLESALAYFRVEARQSKRVPGASDERQLATYPAWSPDGRNLYYCRAPVLWTDRNTVPPERYAEVKYDLMRIPYDIETDQWGEPEKVLSAEETGLSILLPRISPDGRFLLFCMCRYGCFPAFQPTSDLYMMDLETGKYTKLPINSEYSESWHSWSSNSRWIAFSSKRQGGTFTRCYVSYIDEMGQAHTPFVVPQSDPEFQRSLLKTNSVPELLTGPVPVASAILTKAARSEETVAVDVPADTAPRVSNSEPYPQAGP